MNGKGKKRWSSGDLVVIDGVRWVIRVLTPTRAELEAMNTVTAMWRTIPPSLLPTRR